METKTDLSSTTIEKLQELIKINLDSQKGFEEASHEIEDKMIATMFVELSRQRANNAQELQKFLAWNGEEAVHEGSYVATWHRAWIAVKRMFSGGDSHAILSEAERGEDAIKSAYEDVLISTAGSAMNDVLTRQYAVVKAGHDRVRDLRNQLATK